jgi:hypothetical protein
MYTPLCTSNKIPTNKNSYSQLTRNDVDTISQEYDADMTTSAHIACKISGSHSGQKHDAVQYTVNLPVFLRNLLPSPSRQKTFYNILHCITIQYASMYINNTNHNF